MEGFCLDSTSCCWSNMGKKDRGHCGILDCCGTHQPVYNYCMLNRCQNGGKCINNNDGYTCMCHNGYTGNTCEHGPITKAAVATTSKPTSTCVDSSFCYTSAACYLVPDSCPKLCGKCGTGLLNSTLKTNSATTTVNKIKVTTKSGKSSTTKISHSTTGWLAIKGKYTTTGWLAIKGK